MKKIDEYKEALALQSWIVENFDDWLKILDLSNEKMTQEDFRQINNDLNKKSSIAPIWFLSRPIGILLNL